MSRNSQHRLRPALVWAAVIGMTLVLSRVLAAVPFLKVQAVLGGVLTVAVLGVVAACLWRMRCRPKERRGWMLLAIAMVSGMIAQGVLSAAGPLPVQPGRFDWLFFGLQIFQGGLMALAVLAWPWEREGKGHVLVHGLGSLLFAGSMVLLLWMLGWIQYGGSPGNAYHLRLLGLALRMALFGGALIYLVGVDVRRLRGPVGWFLAAVGGMVLLVAVLNPKALDPQVVASRQGWLAVALIHPLLLATGAWLGGPVEVEEVAPPLREQVGEALTLIPFVLSGLMVGRAVLLEGGSLGWPVLGFLGTSGLLVGRQVVLLREVLHINEDLELRVAARTHDLERAQGILLRNERLNALAMIGAGLTHDLNNLLSVIRSSCDLIRLKTPGAAEELARLETAAERASGLTQRLMAFARREDPGSVPMPLDLGHAVAGMQDLLRMVAGKGIELRLDCESTPAVGISLPVLEQILVNLVSNSRDALQGHGRIHIRTGWVAQEGEIKEACLEVEDNGPGIPEDCRDRLFEPFFTTKPKGKGTGLGLASIRMQLAEVQGEIRWVEARMGGGACFRVVLPEVEA